MGAAKSLLAADAVSVRIGGLAAVQDVTFAIDEGEIVSMIGPNGAGKTTTVNAITGFVRLASGSIHFGGSPITGLRPERIAGFGLVRTFQNAAMFARQRSSERKASPAGGWIRS
jgi:branched-chain amino acid transport system ATP-binding protein